MIDPKIPALLTEWSDFTNKREEERHRLQNPPGIADKKAELAALNQELARLRSQAHLLKAQIAMASQGEPYSKPLFDAQWAEKKKALKEQVEKALMAEMVNGKSIPTIMLEYGMRNPVWLYQIKDKLNHHVQSEAVKLAGVIWCWSHFTGTHRYALAKGDTGKWAYVKMMGTLGTELEGEECVWDIETGELLTGSQDVFESDSVAGRNKRKNTLASVLAGTYDGPYKESPNPYYTNEAAQ